MINSKIDSNTDPEGKSMEAKSSWHEFPIDSVVESKLVHKLDLWIAPLMVLSFLVAYLDRANIGNAAIAGMNDDLHLTGTDHLNVAVTVFYVTYILFEIPTSLVMKTIRPSRLIPTLIIGWSLVMIGQAFTKNYASLVVTRILLGVFESGLFPCLAVYLSTFYDRNEQGRRISYLLVAAAISGGFGGLLAFGLTGINSTGTIANWAWLFLVEGLISFVVGVLMIFTLADSFETAFYLTENEKALMRVRQERSRVYQGVEGGFDRVEVVLAFKDPRVWLSAFCQFMSNTCSFGVSNFLPTIISGMGFGRLETQLLTVPVYFWSSAVYLAVSYFSDRYTKRGIFLVPAALITGTGYAMLITVNIELRWIQYLACFFVATGLYCCVGLNVTWLSNNTGGYNKRAAAISLQQTIGNMSGIVSSQIYASNLRDGEGRYVVGHGLSLAAMGLGSLGYTMLWVLWRADNLKRSNMSIEEKQRMLDKGVRGDRHPEFRYTL